MMKVSVVILNWNGCDMLRTFLPSVVRYSEGEGVEVCVADMLLLFLDSPQAHCGP